MTIKDLNINEYNPYYDNYISKVNKATLNDGLATNYKTIELFLKSIPHDKLEYRYADGKWTIKEIVQHLIDTERYVLLERIKHLFLVMMKMHSQLLVLLMLEVLIVYWPNTWH